MAEHLLADARSWAAQVRTMGELADLSLSGAKAGVAQFAQLEMAGSWSVSQLTASRWQDEAERFVTALPRTLTLLETGQLLRHQAVVLLHRTRQCSVEVAGKVEAELLPAATLWCPADIGRRVDRAVLRIESKLADGAAAEQRHAPANASRDRQAGIDRTAPQRRANSSPAGSGPRWPSAPRRVSRTAGSPTAGAASRSTTTRDGGSARRTCCTVSRPRSSETPRGQCWPGSRYAVSWSTSTPDRCRR